MRSPAASISATRRFRVGWSAWTTTSTSSTNGSYSESYIGPPTSATRSRSPTAPGRPERAVGIAVRLDRVAVHLHAEPRCRRHVIAAARHLQRFDEVLVQVGGV